MVLDSSCRVVCLMVGLSLSSQTTSSSLSRVSLLICPLVGCFVFRSRQPADHVSTIEPKFLLSLFSISLCSRSTSFRARYGPPATSAHCRGPSASLHLRPGRPCSPYLLLSCLVVFCQLKRSSPYLLYLWFVFFCPTLLVSIVMGISVSVHFGTSV